MGTAVIIGAGTGLSASLARKLHDRGHKIVMAARNIDKLAELQKQTGATLISCDAAEAADMAAVFSAADKLDGPLEIAIYNPSQRVRGGIAELDPEAVKSAVLTTGYGGFLMAQQAARRMLPNGKGCIFFTGASAGERDIPTPPLSPWGSSPCAGWRKAWRASSIPKAYISAISSLTAAFATPPDRSALILRAIPIPCSTLRRSLTTICISSINPGQAGPGRSNSDPGWKHSELTINTN